MQMVGRTRGDQVVVFDADSSLKGQLLDVEIISSQSLTLSDDSRPYQWPQKRSRIGRKSPRISVLFPLVPPAPLK